jgi:hypothetical protein
MKVVGALSIPMMCIQCPGAAIMVFSIALRLVQPPDYLVRWRTHHCPFGILGPAQIGQVRYSHLSSVLFELLTSYTQAG